METSINHYVDEPIEGIDQNLNVYMHLEKDKSTMIDFGALYGGTKTPIPGHGQLSIINKYNQVSVLILNQKEMILLRDILTNVINLKDANQTTKKVN